MSARTGGNCLHSSKIRASIEGVTRILTTPNKVAGRCANSPDREPTGVSLMTSLILSPKTRRDNATLIERIFARCHEHTPYPPPGDYAGSFDRAANSLEAEINCPLCRNVWAVTFPNIAMLTDMATRYGHLINDADSGEILWVLTCPRCIRHIDDPRAIYADYLRSPHWQSTRAAALDRADHRCQVCNSNKRLEVHHRSYARRGNELPADLVVLCDECHRLFHENREIAS